MQENYYYYYYYYYCYYYYYYFYCVTYASCQYMHIVVICPGCSIVV